MSFMRGGGIYNAALLLSVVVLVILWQLGCTMDMQVNKSSRNVVFFFYSCIMMLIIFRCIPFIDTIFDRLSQSIVISRLFYLFSRRSMTIYLYQSFVFAILCRFGHRLIPEEGIVWDLIRTISFLPIAIIGCALMALIFGNIEDFSRLRHYD